MKHNNILPNVHFHKDWQRHVKTWFDQAGQKKRRRNLRAAKAARIAPRPLDLLRPAVRCPTLKYKTKLRAGRGFTLQELKAAGVPRKQALTIGIPVDHRRRNRSEESLELNVARLKEYQSKLILFPKKSKNPKKGDASAEDMASATQASSILPIAQLKEKLEIRKISAEEKEFRAYSTLRTLRATQRLTGKRVIRKRERDEALEAASKKK